MADRKVLDSWKEISAYLERSIRTCQRLEQELGLPVHRLEETPKARVFAYQDEIDRWAERSRHSEKKAVFGRSGLKKLFIRALVIVSLVVLVVVVWQFFPLKDKGAFSIPEEKASVAVVYFKNNTGDENLDHWRRALSELLTYDLAQSRYIDVLPADRLFEVMDDLNLADTSAYSAQELAQIAANAQMTNIVHGHFAKAGNKFRISATIRDFESGKDTLLASSEGIGEESFFMVVDEMTAKIKQELEFSTEQVAVDIDRKVEEITTSSPEALKFYSAGWNHHIRGNRLEAIHLMEKAIEIDPQFALAYRVMGTLYSHLGPSSLAKEYNQKAFDLRGRVSDPERFLIETIYFASKEGTKKRAIESAKEFLALYPSSDKPYNILGTIYWVKGDWKESLEYHESALAIALHIMNWGNVIVACQGNGYYQRAEQIYIEHRENYPDIYRMEHLWMPEYHYLLIGEYDIALEEAQRLFLMDPSSPSLNIFKADIYHLAGDLAEAEREYLRLLNIVEDGSLEREGRKRLASLNLLQGKYLAARDVLEEVAERGDLQKAALQGQIMNFTSLLAHSYLKTKDFDKAQEVLEYLMNESALDADPVYFRRLALWGKGQIYRELHAIEDLRLVAHELNKTEVPNMSVIGKWYISHTNGLLALEEGNDSEALGQFEKVVSLLPYQNTSFLYNQHAVFLDSLAFAYFKVGDLEKARTEYERITTLTIGRLFYGDIYAKSFYMLGKIYEQQGKKAKSIENYEKFLNLWKDADPGQPEVKDAQARLNLSLELR